MRPGRGGLDIPGNDDALRAIRLFTTKIADSVLEGHTLPAVAGAEQKSAEESGAGGRRGVRRYERVRTYEKQEGDFVRGCGKLPWSLLRLPKPLSLPTTKSARQIGCGWEFRKARPERLGAGQFTDNGVSREISKEAKRKKDEYHNSQLCKSRTTRERIARADQRGSVTAARRSWKRAATSRKPQPSCARRARQPRQRRRIAKPARAWWAATSTPVGKSAFVELNCESDFVARTEAYQQLSHYIAMLSRRWIRGMCGGEEVTPEMLEKERDIYKAQALATGKPEPVVDRLGNMEKFYEENCL